MIEIAAETVSCGPPPVPYWLAAAPLFITVAVGLLIDWLRGGLP